VQHNVSYASAENFDSRNISVSTQAVLLMVRGLTTISEPLSVPLEMSLEVLQDLLKPYSRKDSSLEGAVEGFEEPRMQSHTVHGQAAHIQSQTLIKYFPFMHEHTVG
jgi:hypothetical protein